MEFKPKHPLLIVEDSDEDYFITTRAFKKSGLANPIYRCENGDKALDYLFRQRQYADPATSPRPGVILLDLNLPGTDGREVIQIIKQDTELKKIPIIVLTTSDDERDIRTCYKQGVNSYVRKPVDLERFIEAIQRLKDFWFEIVILPRTE